MKKILFAYVFLLIDLELVVNGDYFSIALPLIAAALLARGFGEVANENEHFEQCVAYSYGMVLMRLVLFVLSYVEVLSVQRLYMVCAALGVLFLLCGLTHRMLCVFHEIELENNLFFASRFCVVGEICLCVLGMGCVFVSENEILRTNFMLLSVVGCGLFLLTLYQLNVVYLRFENAT
ncbi:MAG: hypothetical protein R3Y06_04090 [Faecalibacterium sp.]